MVQISVKPCVDIFSLGTERITFYITLFSVTDSRVSQDNTFPVYKLAGLWRSTNCCSIPRFHVSCARASGRTRCGDGWWMEGTPTGTTNCCTLQCWYWKNRSDNLILRASLFWMQSVGLGTLFERTSFNMLQNIWPIKAFILRHNQVHSV